MLTFRTVRQALLFDLKWSICHVIQRLLEIFTNLWSDSSPELESMGAFHSTKNSGNSGLGSEWNSHFPEFHSEILGVPHEVGLKFRKIGITGKFRSIRPFLLGPSFSEPGNRINMADPQASKHNTGPLSDKWLKYLTATLLQWINVTSFSE